ncbi:MAG: bifunctional (p)ppGpp synthetase/guanosine-3',5'-bis(diphosphate) 3'-pyrophosphohydrolase [DPANN group archaeon]|nr:bifunctional (p)ppGpp synthetase/guanosine-3',5'-bis(diphosphate) 3'-pyrophosphohydrolase [DPANN group archaeon]
MENAQEKKMNFLERAEKFAAYKHRNQKRKDGKTPYIAHPIAVAEIIKSAGITDGVSVASALLHDTVEDTDATLEEICREFGPEVAHYVCLLTRVRGDDRDAYHERIVYASPKEVQIIKLADVLNNLSTLDNIADAAAKEKFRKNVTHALEKYYLPLAKKISPRIYNSLKLEIRGLANKSGAAALFPDFEAC